MRILSAAAICLLVFCGVAAAGEFRGPPWFSAARCTNQDAIAADENLDHLDSWPAIFRAFRLYRQCDDGGVAEGWSDTVAILLTEHWPDVTRLSELTQTNPEFGNFVLLHVDESIGFDQAKMIVDNAKNRCPAAAKRLCKRLEARVKNPD